MKENSPTEEKSFSMWGLALIEMTFRTEKEDREFLYDSANKKEKQTFRTMF